MHMTWGFVVAAVIQKVWIRPGAWRLTRIFAGDKVPPRVPYGAFVLVRVREDEPKARREASAQSRVPAPLVGLPEANAVQRRSEEASANEV